MPAHPDVQFVVAVLTPTLIHSSTPGTGKTIMMLSLILATLDQLSSPEEAFHEQRIPMTPLALRHFPTPSATAERAKLPNPRRFYRDTGLPSLVELMLHEVRVSPSPAHPLREHLDMLGQHLLRPLRANVPFYLHTDPPRDVGYGTARGANAVVAPRVVYLTAATLVVVPDNLQIQWANEVLKHCTDVLRMLFVKDKDALPDAPVLATDYDVSCLPEADTCVGIWTTDFVWVASLRR